MSNTPPSDKHMPDGPDWAPEGIKRNPMPVGESENCGREMPLKEQNSLKDAAGAA